VFYLLISFSLTGENEPQRKGTSCPVVKTDSSILELDNILFMGTNVISGSGLAVVVRTGDGKFLPLLYQ
jgi:Mg2+-importing ATPase